MDITREKIRSSAFLSASFAALCGVVFGYAMEVFQQQALPLADVARQKFLVEDPSAGMTSEVVLTVAFNAITAAAASLVVVPIMNWVLDFRSLIYPAIAITTSVAKDSWWIVAGLLVGFRPEHAAFAPHSVVSLLAVVFVFLGWSFLYLRRNLLTLSPSRSSTSKARE